MARYVLLKTLDVELVAAAPGGATVATVSPTPTGKADVAVEFAGVDADGKFTFQVPAYDPSTHNVLDALHVSLFEKPQGGSAATVPADPAEIVKAPLHYETDTSKVTAGETVVVDATAAPEGNYSAALVAEFDA